MYPLTKSYNNKRDLFFKNSFTKVTFWINQFLVYVKTYFINQTNKGKYWYLIYKSEGKCALDILINLKNDTIHFLQSK